MERAQTCAAEWERVLDARSAASRASSTDNPPGARGALPDTDYACLEPLLFTKCADFNSSPSFARMTPPLNIFRSSYGPELPPITRSGLPDFAYYRFRE